MGVRVIVVGSGVFTPRNQIPVAESILMDHDPPGIGEPLFAENRLCRANRVCAMRPFSRCAPFIIPIGVVLLAAFAPANAQPYAVPPTWGGDIWTHSTAVLNNHTPEDRVTMAAEKKPNIVSAPK